jgi:neutral ceramidase
LITAGFAHVDITPAIGCAMQGYAARKQPALGLRDPLFARAMALESNGNRIAVVGLDLISVDAELVATARKIAEAECGLPAGSILICASHTHWGPVLRSASYLPQDLRVAVRPEYAEELALKLGMAVVLADRRRQPARIGLGSGWNPLISFNRRPLDADGRCVMNLTAPPEVAAWAAADGARQAVEALDLNGVGPTPLQPSPPRPKGELGELRWGPTDPQVPIIRVEGEGATLGGVASFACHPVCGAGDEAFYDISADYPGAMQRMLAATLGCPLVFALGCAGNQVPIQRGPGSRERVGHSLAAEVLRVWESIELHDDVPLAAAQASVALPIKDFASMEPPDGDDAQARHLRSLIEKYGGQTEVELEVQALAVGPMGVVSLPGEIFAEIGHAIKHDSPFGLTMPVSCANDSLSYIATREAYDQGGYEPGWNIPAPDAAEVLIDGAKRVLQDAFSRVR